MAEASEQKKIDRLRNLVAQKKSLLVAFSGGVDSSVLARVAHDMLGQSAAAATIDSPTFARAELRLARRIASEIGIRHFVLSAPVLDPELVRNSCDRCYFCKQGDIALLREAAAAHGIGEIAFGVTFSDYSEHRPGLRALAEAKAFLPLVEAGIHKKEVGAIARDLGLSNWDLTSTTCLSSRIPYGQKITPAKLSQVEAAEKSLARFGLRHIRVRHHGDMARIEVLPEDFSKLLALGSRIAAELKALGFTYVAMDLEGYRSGSMDEALKKNEP